VVRWIERITEPKKLFLAWQAPDHMGERYRWAVGTLEPRDSAGRLELRYFRAGPEFERFNPKHTYEQLMTLGYAGYPGFSLKKNTHERGVSEAFMRRLPPRRRPDFSEYMRQFRLTPGLNLSDLSLLGRTEAKLPGDGFSVVDPLDPNDKCCDLLLEVAGYRYYFDKLDVEPNVDDPVEVSAETDNAYDSYAVQFLVRGRKIGNVNRLQAPTLLRWLAECRVSGVIERLNGKVDRPRAFVFVAVRPFMTKVAA
jgi:hypothetical protein